MSSVTGMALQLSLKQEVMRRTKPISMVIPLMVLGGDTPRNNQNRNPPE